MLLDGRELNIGTVMTAIYEKFYLTSDSERPQMKCLCYVSHANRGHPGRRLAERLSTSPSCEKAFFDAIERDFTALHVPSEIQLASSAIVPVGVDEESDLRHKPRTGVARTGYASAR